MSDGANYGIGASRALDTILGGKPSPKKDEGMTPEQMHENLMSAPDELPKGAWDSDSGAAYDLAARIAGKRVLKFLIEHPEYAELPTEGEGAWKDRANYKGFYYKTDGISQKLKKHGVDVDEGLGLSGFMFGWAVNAAKYAVGAPPVRNPALITINA